MNQTSHAPLEAFLSVNDFSPNTVQAFRQDFRKFTRWYESANGERYADERVTPRDISDFRRHLREVRRQAVSTTNRALVVLRRYFGFLVKQGVLTANPAEGVKELRRVMGPPKAIERLAVRRILREATVRRDRRGLAILSLMLYAGLRVGEVAALELSDLDLSERRGTVRVRDGKGRKERSVPLSIEARKAISDHLGTRPPVEHAKVFTGRGGRPLGTDGIRYLVGRYGLSAEVKIHPHALRHTMATEYLSANQNDLVGLAQLLGHESIQTTSRYTRRTIDVLSQATERVMYGS